MKKQLLAGRMLALGTGLAFGTGLALPSGASAQTAQPPRAEKRPYQVTSANGNREDDYYWLRDDKRQNADMLAYLRAENAYADAQLAPLKPLEAKLYAETVAHIKQDDDSVPYRENGYWYQTTWATGADYPQVIRRKGIVTAAPVVLFDQPAMAKGHNFFQIGGWQVSPDNARVAWAEDTVGRRQYVLKVKDIATGQLLSDRVANVEGGLVWSADGRTIFYVEKDPVTLLSKRVKAHVLGTPASADRLVYEEGDDSFYMGVGQTSDRRYICIHLQSTVSDEQRCAPAANPAAFTVVAPRAREFRYNADHIGNRWIIRTNAGGAKNYKLATVADVDAAKGTSAWRDVVPASATTFIEDFKPFAGFVAIEQRAGGNKGVRLLTDAGKSIPVAADEPAYAMGLSVNEEVDTPWVRYSYTSLVTPTTTYEINAKTGERRTLKVQPVPGYDKANYVTERVWATARDGVRVPVSLMYRRGTKRDGTAPLFQYAYGSYGISSDPGFSAGNLALVDRGVVYAVAHIRGGQEMGRDWYDQGHLLNKKNSFNDFVDVTRYLVANKYAAPGRVAAMGGSAGGLLMGGVANLAPKDYAVLVAQVPFVDVVTTMLDASIPLTTNEYDEWGNPADKRYYDYMLSYSPYDNVARKAYPAMYVSTGLWDSQVQYYEPTKWVARLREMKTDKNPLIYRVNMEAGHGGKSGRFERYRQAAEWQAFVLQQLKVAP
ncbi:oligopeptidase B Serine peptidase. MEROPS family S09A [Sphingomonas palmae]|uniref:Oligopeptidase B Serine peptidase. MEROPS family S09A n=1 Tax=Sphingomonas palmae TaxID=1855283 RepID=A0A1H7M525_9SPHN|nr:S9 family peptidase [Sphingomonas palmae]SEL05687.1 oligopeptidase B Serine peptidase. MEROPS family S09A [Sphingomonas palmae]